MINKHSETGWWSRNANIWLIATCGVLISIGINFTRVPIIYAFRIMTCDEFYQHHPPYAGSGHACDIPDIEAKTAREVSILGATVTINGIFNLIITNWSMKTFGLKPVLIQQLLGPTIRLGFQLIGVHMGGSRGILFVQVSQLLGVVGGSTGYVLVLNTFVSRLIEPKMQTSAFGQLHGGIMLGTALAYVLGGATNEAFGINITFETACAIMLLSIFFSLFAMPSVAREEVCSDAETTSALMKVIKPLKTLMPVRVNRSDSAGTKRSYQRPLLAIGVLLGVLATGFIPILLQLYSTNRFGFDSKENGYLMGLTFGVRSLFLTLVFPVIISAGRRWFGDGSAKEVEENLVGEDALVAETESTPLLSQAAAKESPVDVRFDLWFLTTSFFVDATLTAATAQCRTGWQLYLAATLLPLASGSAPAAKGVIVSLCEPHEKTDALAGMAMVEMLATIVTMTLFGAIFAALAVIDRSNLVFYINGGVAVLAAMTTLFVRISPR